MEKGKDPERDARCDKHKSRRPTLSCFDVVICHFFVPIDKSSNRMEWMCKAHCIHDHQLITALCCLNLFRSHHNGEGRRRGHCCADYQDCMRRRADAAAEAAAVEFSTRRTSPRLKKEAKAAPTGKRKSTGDDPDDAVADDLAPKQKKRIKKISSADGCSSQLKNSGEV